MSEFPPASPPPPPPPPPPSPPPPPLPPSIEDPGRARFVQFARAAWVSVLLAFVIEILLQVVSTSGGKTWKDPAAIQIVITIQCGALGLIMLGGIGAGVAALFGVKRYGNKGIMVPAVTGLAIWLTLILLAVPAGLSIAAAARTNRPTPQSPASHQPGARRIEVPEAGCSFDLPEGYTELPAGTPLNGGTRGFIRQMSGEPPRAVMISLLKGPIPRKHLQLEDRPGANKMDRFFWRGIEVDGFRVTEQGPAGPYMTWTVEVPLRPHAMQLSFSGAASAETELRRLAADSLTSLEGASTW